MRNVVIEVIGTNTWLALHRLADMQHEDVCPQDAD